MYKNKCKSKVLCNRESLKSVTLAATLGPGAAGVREAAAGPPPEMIRTHASVKSLENSGLSSAHLALRG